MLPFALLDTSRYPLALAPSDQSGWFSGTALVAVDPVSCETGLSLAGAAAALERTFTAQEFGITAAVIGYDGSAEVRTYAGALTHSASGWFGHGAAPAVPGDPPSRAVRAASNHPTPSPVLGRARTDMDEADWVRRVEAAQEMIREGSVYVLNLTMRVEGKPRLAPVEVFARLQASSGAPMAALWGSPDNSLCSVSPERFLGLTLGDDRSTRRAEVWPIKGTAPRGASASQDADLARRLAANEKERAEHVMVVDMERNDLGRVCVAGSVSVEPLMDVFPTPYCHQMVSCVSGDLRPDVDFADLIEATFPCGSVTGAPKIAAMRIIEELETGPRGPYTGALLVAMPGRLDSSVLIRTLEYRPDGRAVWGTGCGITIDSDPVAEWHEARLKTSPVLD